MSRRWRRPKTIQFDPDWLAYRAGDFVEATAQDIEHYVPDTPGATLRILRHMIERLPEPDRTCVESVVWKRNTYAVTSEYLVPVLGYQPDLKTVWRWTRRGERRLRKMLRANPWAGALTEGQLEERP